MGIHQGHEKMREDEEFYRGELKYIVEGNICRYLDGRRTEGYIEEVFHEKGMFRWRITTFEDKENFWDMTFEDIGRFQFEKDSKTLLKQQEISLQDKVEMFDKNIEIQMEDKKLCKTYAYVEKKAIDIIEWIENEVENGECIFIDLENENYNPKIAQLLKKYMIEIGCYELEKKTAENIALNPNSGEWFKGMLIVMAEMGLINYYGKIPRSEDLFTGIGRKSLREKYILNRIAFVKAVFKLSDIEEVILYRGMSTEQGWSNKKRNIMHMTFSSKVAEAFSTTMDKDSRFKTAYIVKMTVSVYKLFMTFIETKEFNEKYKEQEAILLGENTFVL